LKTFPVLNIHEWDDQMRPSSPTRHYFEATSIAPHDFSLTENYYVFVENRADTEVLPYILGTKLPAECINIEHSKPMKLHLVPRPKANGEPNSAKKLAIDLAPGFTIHSVCAFEKSEGGRDVLELYTTSWLSETVASGQVKGGLLGSWEGVDGVAPHFDQIPVTLLYRTVVDTTTGELVYHGPAKGMDQTIIEHPHANPLYEGRKCRYLYMSLGSCEGLSSPPLGYLRLDIETGARQEWFAPLHTFCEEVVVVPKNFDDINKKVAQGAPRDCVTVMKEDSVWVLTNMYDAVKDKTCFAIFDGEHIDKGPVARIWTDRLPHSLHGSYTPDLFVDM
jgi:carotenoid cleavage dioxygenase-like enzyme